MRYEVRFYDARNSIRVSVELPAADGRAAEWAAQQYLRHELVSQLVGRHLIVGAVAGVEP